MARKIKGDQERPLQEGESRLSNFKIAFRELVHGESYQEEIVGNDESGTVDSKEQIAADRADAEEIKTQVLYTPEEATQIMEEEPEEEEQVPDITNDMQPIVNGGQNVRTKTVIAQDVEIIGDISAKGDVDILGEIKGNIVSEGHLMVAGNVNGSIVAESADFENGTLVGETIQVQSHITIKQGVQVIGQIQAVSMDVNGKIEGNIVVMDQIVLNAGADITGDITAQYISVQKGAVVNGNLRISQNQE